jgi:hypothetical protein
MRPVDMVAVNRVPVKLGAYNRIKGSLDCYVKLSDEKFKISNDIKEYYLNQLINFLQEIGRRS